MLPSMPTNLVAACILMQVPLYSQLLPVLRRCISSQTNAGFLPTTFKLHQVTEAQALFISMRHPAPNIWGSEVHCTASFSLLIVGNRSSPQIAYWVSYQSHHRADIWCYLGEACRPKSVVGIRVSGTWRNTLCACPKHLLLTGGIAQ
jgi:hypothetical protein